jgi:hypothetical protein
LLDGIKHKRQAENTTNNKRPNYEWDNARPKE